MGGGSGNTADGNDAVSGTVSNGRFPFAYFFSGSATVAGGYHNSASSTCATVPGGAFNTAAGDFSFAGGFNAGALHDGSFVWADDSSSSSFASTAANQFLIRAHGGVGIGTEQTPPGGLHVASGGLAVSGANGLNPGIALHQDGFNDGGQNVALSGRVYALADAANGAIKPGDLLTTSDTPGHAMKVTDHARAQGAILGKAMSALKEGQGLVLILVTLQ